MAPMEATLGAPAPEYYNQLPATTPLWSWARLFFRQLSPRLIALALLASLGLRLALGGFGSGDLITAAVIVAVQPFQEWNIHVFILHFRPRRTRSGKKIDLYIARKHRAHHVDPNHIGLTLVQTPALVGLILGFAVITAAILRSPLALTADVAGYVMLMAYEWTHFIIHSSWAPRSWVYKRVWRAHRLHHYKNEHYWFGITTHLADHILRTYPDRSAVETSPTARDLHSEVLLAQQI